MNEQTYTRVNESTFPEKRLEGNKELNLDEQQKKCSFYIQETSILLLKHLTRK